MRLTEAQQTVVDALREEGAWLHLRFEWSGDPSAAHVVDPSGNYGRRLNDWCVDALFRKGLLTEDKERSVKVLGFAYVLSPDWEDTSVRFKDRLTDSKISGYRVEDNSEIVVLGQFDHSGGYLHGVWRAYTIDNCTAAELRDIAAKLDDLNGGEG